ncbi:peptidase S10 serine carboxypeptidase [Ceratobasidium sp. AG-I]|nr:peptidase S10 serine carboxypeptidase [Ceratobasidium sp. AG-I]
MKASSGVVCLALALAVGTVSVRVSESLNMLERLSKPQHGFCLERNHGQHDHFSHSPFLDRQLRIKSPRLCDSSVKQYSGYLAVTKEKSIFFWFFEARNKPETAPLVIWLNGGPGCSSTQGLFYEVGPCTIGEEGRATTRNEYSWNTNANMLFIDQPAGVGFSYNDGPMIGRSTVAAEDMWTFLQLFYNRFGQYSGELHIAGESYGGTYVPHIASEIWKKNKAPLAGSGSLYINLTSIIMGNGLTDPYIQFSATYEWLCEGKWNAFDKNGSECAKLKDSTQACQRLIKACNEFDTDLACRPASTFCFTNVLGPIVKTGLNPYDARQKCNLSQGHPPCYPYDDWITKYFDKPEVRKELGVPLEKKFMACKLEIHQTFLKNGDAARSSSILLPELIDEGLRVLVYVGDADLICPGVGQIPWLENLNTKFQHDFNSSLPVPFYSHNRTAGFTRSSSGNDKAGRISYVHIYEAGHIAPHDQPEAIFDMIHRWIEGRPLSNG